ncbi:ATP-binding region, ATPase domain protein (fragment) [metagenome]|uniref:histidine kinase n=1 Tax=metagenome TaxID=256318 RepID=A0A2P2C7B7_9ZZZZ
MTASLAAIGRSSTRLTRLVEDLLLLSRVDDPDTPLRAAPVALHELVHRVLDSVEVQARAGGLTLSYAPPSEPVVASGDAAELESLVGNLVGNAVRYTPPGGTVTVALRRSAGQVLLTCTDNGLGISEADQERVFEEFFRSSNPGALARPGTGLGLAIARRIVQRHRGRLELTSALGVGSTFSVWLPAAT